MIEDDIPETSADAPQPVPKRGRRASGQTRSEIERKSTKARKTRLVNSGKRNLDTYVDPDTKELLQDLKKLLGLSTEGEVIDYLVRDKMKIIKLTGST